MNYLIHAALSMLVAAIISVAFPQACHSQTPVLSGPRNGEHDFDFNVGVWHTHLTRTLEPFTSGSKTVELNGTVTVRRVWDGKAEIEEIEADGPVGHWEGLTLFLYNPIAHQWSQTFANSKIGALSSNFGGFRDGRVVLVGQDTVDGVWSDIKPDSHQYEESYSNDGGATWARSLDETQTMKITLTSRRP